ncbi:MAG: hypothetical protein JWQ84_2346 [Mucilaginibacter sp.]|nr:hypothetical protein [Mucilaginibacter sp.]
MLVMDIIITIIMTIMTMTIVVIKNFSWVKC